MTGFPFLPARVEIKICGLTCFEDARFALAAGADYLGFVFHRGSPRHVTPAAAQAIVARLGGGVRAVGVFVNVTPCEALAVARQCGLWAVQLHGCELPGPFAGYPARLWRSVSFREGRPSPDPSEWKAARLVVDAFAPGGQYGGTGRIADWAAAAVLARERQVMLAGGLTPENVAAAVAEVRPAGVDVSGGVERSPGRKDQERIRAFIRAVRGPGIAERKVTRR